MIPKLKKQINGETHYNFRTIQIIVTLLAIPPAILGAIFIHWIIPVFIAIWLAIGILRIQIKFINQGEKYAPGNF